eukprot:241337-Prymnesium_polylepis.1
MFRAESTPRMLFGEGEAVLGLKSDVLFLVFDVLFLKVDVLALDSTGRTDVLDSTPTFFRAFGKSAKTLAASSKLYEPGMVTVMIGSWSVNALQISNRAWGSVGTATTRSTSGISGEGEPNSAFVRVFDSRARVLGLTRVGEKHDERITVRNQFRRVDASANCAST